jgi:hypothetical protein
MTDRNQILFSTLFYLVGFAMTFFGSGRLLEMWRLECRGIRTAGRIIAVSGTDAESLTTFLREGRAKGRQAIRRGRMNRPERTQETPDKH